MLLSADFMRCWDSTFAWSAGLDTSRWSPLLDLSVADCFEPPPTTATRALVSHLDEVAEHRYNLRGLASFDDAARAFLQAQHGVTVPGDGILNVCGAKAGLALSAVATLGPGCLAVVTVPGYPLFESWAERLGADVVALPLRRANAFLPDLSELEAAIRGRSAVVVVNYPNNPTGASAGAREIEKMIALCDAHGALLINDAAYSSLSDSRTQVVSFLRGVGPDSAVLEIHSLSKTFQVPGWRLGFVAGSPQWIQRLRHVRPIMDSGSFTATQRAGAEALRSVSGLAERNRELSRRREALAALLRCHGFDVEAPTATPFVYAPAPIAEAAVGRLSSAREAARLLVERCGVVSTPFDQVEPSLRFAVTWPGGADAMLSRLEQRLGNVQLEFARSTPEAQRLAR